MMESQVSIAPFGWMIGITWNVANHSHGPTSYNADKDVDIQFSLFSYYYVIWSKVTQSSL